MVNPSPSDCYTAPDLALAKANRFQNRSLFNGRDDSVFDLLHLVVQRRNRSIFIEPYIANQPAELMTADVLRDIFATMNCLIQQTQRIDKKRFSVSKSTCYWALSFINLSHKASMRKSTAHSMSQIP
jgi:hypothetical protein